MKASLDPFFPATFELRRERHVHATSFGSAARDGSFDPCLMKSRPISLEPVGAKQYYPVYTDIGEILPNPASSLFATTAAKGGSGVWAPPPVLQASAPRRTKTSAGFLFSIGILLTLVAAFMVVAATVPDLAVASCLAALSCTLAAVWLVWRTLRVRKLLSWGHSAEATIIAAEQRHRLGRPVFDLSYRFVDDRGLTQAGVASGVSQSQAAVLGLNAAPGAPFCATVVYDRRDSRRNFLYRAAFVTLRDETAF
jgi:hypothetical protein